MTIRFIAREAYAEEEHILRPLLLSAFKFQADVQDLDQMLESYHAGHAILLAIETDGKPHTAVLGEIIRTAQGLVFRVLLAAGTFLGSEVELEEFAAFLRPYKVRFIEGWVRPSVARLLSKLGFNHTYTIVRKEV